MSFQLLLDVLMRFGNNGRQEERLRREAELKEDLLVLLDLREAYLDLENDKFEVTLEEVDVTLISEPGEIREEKLTELLAAHETEWPSEYGHRKFGWMLSRTFAEEWPSRDPPLLTPSFLLREEAPLSLWL